MTIRKRIAALLRRTANWIDRHDRERAFYARIERLNAEAEASWREPLPARIERLNERSEGRFDCGVDP
jgi:hypothetical protein